MGGPNPLIPQCVMFTTNGPKRDAKGMAQTGHTPSHLVASRRGRQIRLIQKTLSINNYSRTGKRCSQPDGFDLGSLGRAAFSNPRRYNHGTGDANPDLWHWQAAHPTQHPDSDSSTPLSPFIWSSYGALAKYYSFSRYKAVLKVPVWPTLSELEALNLGLTGGKTKTTQIFCRLGRQGRSFWSPQLRSINHMGDSRTHSAGTWSWS
jgi:hypothetical protein